MDRSFPASTWFQFSATKVSNQYHQYHRRFSATRGIDKSSTWRIFVRHAQGCEMSREDSIAHSLYRPSSSNFLPNRFHLRQMGWIRESGPKSQSSRFLECCSCDKLNVKKFRFCWRDGKEGVACYKREDKKKTRKDQIRGGVLQRLLCQQQQWLGG